MFFPPSSFTNEKKKYRNNPTQTYTDAIMTQNWEKKVLEKNEKENKERKNTFSSLQKFW